VLYSYWDLGANIKGDRPVKEFHQVCNQRLLTYTLRRHIPSLTVAQSSSG